MRSECLFNFAVLLCLGSALSSVMTPTSARARTLSENFSTVDHWDAAATEATGNPGVWNPIAGQSGQPGPCAMAPAMDNGSTSQVIGFGDGSDGILDSSSGYTFDTTTNPNGYNFVSVNVTGSPGSVTVTGANPLILRSLGTVNITPQIDVSGAAGAASADGGAGGDPNTSLATGGSGGSAAGGNGGQGALADGSAGGGAGGAGCGGALCTRGGQSFPAGTAGDFDVAGGFTAGGAGGGGGGNSVSLTAGGGGGAGGGAIRISALGTITVGTILANGGNGGSNGTVSATCASANCSGGGTGGNGGSVWLQSFNGITVTSVSALVGVVLFGNGLTGAAAGKIRGDEPGAPAAWTTGGTNGNVPTLASAGTYQIVSSAYDLGTTNALFGSAPSVTPSTGATVQYAASSDGTDFTSWTTDITTLSNQNFRYLKFEITLNAATQTFVNSISIPYDGPSLDSAELGLAAGCGGVERISSKDGSSNGGHSDRTGMMMTCLWALFYLLAWRIFTASGRWSRCP